MSDYKPQFEGFYVPNSTQVPDTLFDELMADLSGAELKVVLYIIRRTFGFKRQSDTISINQLLRGITKKNGEVLDRGTGLAKPTLLRALRSLTERAIILPARQFDEKGGNKATEYRLHIASTTEPQAKAAPSNIMLPRGLGKKMIQGEAQNVTKPLVKKSYPQDTGIQDTANTVNVNGSVNTDDAHHTQHGEPDRTDLRRLPDLNQGREETQYVAEYILAELSDEHSQAFYYLVAAKVPEHVVRKTLSEIKHDGARFPARAFAHRMKQYAAERLAKSGTPNVLSAITDLAYRKNINSIAGERRL
jgi:hypothetical protein